MSGFFLVLLLMLALQVSRGGPPRSVEEIIYILASFVIATTIHEFMHAYTAWRLGDSTARDLGRITLNPAAHFDPFGFFGMVMISLGYSFIGWGKPVPVNPNRLNGLLGKGIDGRKRAFGLIALAGPISNVVQGGVAALALRLADRANFDLGSVGTFLGWYVFVNVLLAAFNMIPVPPLDGHKILTAILPNFWYSVLAPMERYGFMILFGLFFVSSWLGFGAITTAMIAPMRDLLLNIFF
jgi:Zn-dependent protease